MPILTWPGVAAYAILSCLLFPGKKSTLNSRSSETHNGKKIQNSIPFFALWKKQAGENGDSDLPELGQVVSQMTKTSLEQTQ